MFIAADWRVDAAKLGAIDGRQDADFAIRRAGNTMQLLIEGEPTVATDDAGTDGQAVLSVNGPHLREILSYIRRFKGLGRKPASFAFADGQLRVELPDCRLAADAVGTWPQVVQVSLTDLRKIARELTILEGPVTIRIQDGRLRIGGYSADYSL
jgi:hypothetical protein